MRIVEEIRLSLLGGKCQDLGETADFKISRDFSDFTKTSWDFKTLRDFTTEVSAISL
jgi:hypothetical protein